METRKVRPGCKKVTDDLGFFIFLLKSRENVYLSTGGMFFYFCMSLTQGSKSSVFRLKNMFKSSGQSIGYYLQEVNDRQI